MTTCSLWLVFSAVRGAFRWERRCPNWLVGGYDLAL